MKSTYTFITFNFLLLTSSYGCCIYFYLTFFIGYLCFIKYKKESIGEGFLAIAFVGIVFAVGWTIAAF